MRRLSIFGLVFVTSLLAFDRADAGVELGAYRGVVGGLTLSVSRGLSLANAELEAARTECVAVGLDLVPERLRIYVPFGHFAVDTRGRAADVLPIGGLDVRTIGAMVRWNLGRRSGPYVGLGGSFYTFEEMFGGTPANINNSFGAEGEAGVRFAIIDEVLGLARVVGTVGYQFSLLRVGVSVPGRRDVDDVALDRHTIVLAIEVSALR